MNTAPIQRRARDLQENDTIWYCGNPHSVVSIRHESWQVTITARELPDGEPAELPSVFSEDAPFSIVTGLIAAADGALCAATLSQATRDAWPHSAAPGGDQ